MVKFTLLRTPDRNRTMIRASSLYLRHRRKKRRRLDAIWSRRHTEGAKSIGPVKREIKERFGLGVD